MAAVEAPATTLPGDEAVSLTVSGRFAHFKRIEGTNARTYHVIPRTTVSGFLAALVGRGRDQYYDVFHPERTRVAVTVDRLGGEYAMAKKHLGTRKSTKKSDRGHTTGNELTSSHYTRPEAEQALTKAMGSLPSEAAIYGTKQRPIIHMLRDVQYTIDVVFDLDDDRAREFRDELVGHLDAGTSVYTPYLGTSECLASVSANGADGDGRIPITDPADDEAARTVDSVLPLSAVNPAESGRFMNEKHPYQMAQVKGGRRNDGTLPIAYSEDGALIATSACGKQLGDRTVAFY